jgi:hypothetical protein
MQLAISRPVNYKLTQGQTKLNECPGPRNNHPPTRLIYEVRAMPALFAALATRYPSAAQCAAALGMSRQAFSQAQARRRLSERATLRAAALLSLDPAAALLINATSKDIPAPELETTPDTPAQIQDEKKPLKSKAQSGYTQPTTNYTRDRCIKKSDTMRPMQKTIHVIPQSEKRIFELEAVQWMLTVPRISPDSPRFAHYFSRWLVPEKIAAAKARGTFEETVKNCPLFAPELLDFIQSGLDEYHAFTKHKNKAQRLEQPAPPAVKLSAKAA